MTPGATERKEKAPPSRGVTRGLENARGRRKTAGSGTRSGRKAGDVHRPIDKTAVTRGEFRRVRNRVIESAPGLASVV